MLTRILTLLLASVLADSAAASASSYGPADCRIDALLPAPMDARVSWRGACRDGFAEGPGILAWNDADDSERRIEGTLARGVVAGAAKLSWAAGKNTRGADQDRDSYEGTLRSGQPDGQGFFQFADGAMYEGGVANGKPEGTGIRIDADRSRYEGQWMDGKRHGKGRATFTLGGHYDGEWKNDRYDGAGTIVYAGMPRTWQGQFHDGRPEGTPAPAMGPPRDYNAGARSARTFTDGASASRSYLPPAASWEELSVEQQNVDKARYPTLAPGDEPPYRLPGNKSLTPVTEQLVRTYGPYHGVVWIYVTVSAEGKATTARVIGKVPEPFGRYLVAAVMSRAYKPAKCSGVPCEMMSPMGFKFY